MNRREFTLISLILFMTVIAWIAFGIYHTHNTSTLSEKQLKNVVPLTATFDNEIIKRLKSREE